MNIFFYRFGKRYELPLLIQSLVMTLAMFLMVHLCVTVRRSNQLIRARERTFSGINSTSLSSLLHEAYACL